MCCRRYWVTLGALMGGMAVACGAFAAHGLKDHFYEKYAHEMPATTGEASSDPKNPVAEKHLADFKTGAEYQMYHALALVALGLFAENRKCRLLVSSGVCFLIGILLFSGCLYAYTLTDNKLLIIPIPIGGLFYIIGWGLLAWGAWPRGPAPVDSSC